MLAAATLLVSTGAYADTNDSPFNLEIISDTPEEKEGEGSCGEGTCGVEKEDTEGTCGAEKEGSEGAEKEGAEGSCGADKKEDTEGSCGEGSCGATV